MRPKASGAPFLRQICGGGAAEAEGPFRPLTPDLSMPTRCLNDPLCIYILDASNFHRSDQATPGPSLLYICVHFVRKKTERSLGANRHLGMFRMGPPRRAEVEIRHFGVKHLSLSDHIKAQDQKN